MSYNNTYYIMRHGESEANVSSLIISDPISGVQSYGLTEKGKADAEQAVKESGLMETIDIIYTSEFKRAKETAVIAATLCGVEVRTTPLLNERFFGKYDRLGDEHYRLVWAMDVNNSHNNAKEVESTFEVAQRLARLIARCEKSHRGEAILLVSHGDPLQILLAIARGDPPHSHRDMEHLGKGEIRKLIIGNNILLEEISR